MYAIPGAPFVLKVTKKMKNMLGDNVNKYIPISIILEDGMAKGIVLEQWIY